MFSYQVYDSVRLRIDPESLARQAQDHIIYQEWLNEEVSKVYLFEDKEWLLKYKTVILFAKQILDHTETNENMNAEWQSIKQVNNGIRSLG